MLKPTEDRLDYGKILAPPPDYVCEFAVGTTYSLDLEALVGVPLALFLSEEMDGTLIENPVYLLEGIRKSSDRFTLFCEGGQIKAPGNSNAVFSLLENSVFEVALKNDRSFHPKIWLIKYVSKTDKDLYRLVVLSRNLTFDRSWDIAVTLEGEPTGRKTLKNRPLGDFLRYLRRFAGDNKKKKRIEMLAEELDYVHFNTGDRRFTDYDFLPLGIGDGYGKDETEIFETYHDLLVFSPFLSRDTVSELDGLSLSNPHKTLITRKTEIPKLDENLLASFDCYCLKDAVVDGEEAISEDGDRLSGIQKQDIHAKLYFKSKGAAHTLFVGSANCSASAFGGNIEFLLRLRYEKWGFRIAQIIDELFGGDQKDFDERENPFEKIVTMPEGVVGEQDPQARLQKAIKRLCRSRSHAVAAENGQKYDVAISFEQKYIAGDIDLTISPLTGSSKAMVAGETVISGLTLLELTEFYVITASCGEESLQRVIKIRTDGIPDERDSEVYKSIIRDRNTFLRYVAFLLSDDYLLSALEQMEARNGRSKNWDLHSYGTPVLYENMLKVVAHSPEKFGDIENIINRLDGREIIPPEFAGLYKTFLKVSRKVKR